MPVVSSKIKRSPFWLINGHFQSVYPSLYRQVDGVTYERERLTLKDGDFVDLDWQDQGNDKLLIISHGLEGNSNRQYVKGAAKLFAQNGWDILAWNCRSCSGEMNRAFRLYHHGDIDDISEVIAHAQKRKDYRQISLMGHSMGGSITLKYIGTKGNNLDKNIKSATVFSVPFDLEAGADILNKRSNKLYYDKFLSKLQPKIEYKDRAYPGRLDTSNFDRIEVWRDFDEFFSAPMNGYRDAADFYEQSSAINYIDGINIPTLACNAQNDPILPKECYPTEACSNHPHLYLEIPKTGGHCGFLQPGDEFAYSERRALEFVENSHR
ncbi:MAG: alpha/beta fold hydrolase [Bacteroidetes bacterium]|nr:MAG: alpha/beta fold hydrolase [Bacteroidota bacterium]